MNEKNFLLFIKKMIITSKIIQGRALHVHMVYSNLKKCVWSGLAQDCWQELPFGVTTAGTMMTAGEKHWSINFWALTCIWKMRNEANTNLLIAQTHLTPLPTRTKKNPQAEDRQSGGIFPTPATATMAYVCLQELQGLRHHVLLQESIHTFIFTL